MPTPKKNNVLEPQVGKAVKSDALVVVVLLHGGPVTPEEALSDVNVDAILDGYYLGQYAGSAIMDTVFGRSVPSGRLPFTLYPNNVTLPSIDSYDPPSPPGRTYKYFTGTPLLPFGYGLSYTSFQWSGPQSPSSVTPCQTFNITATVHNTGAVEADEIALLFLSPPSTSSYVTPRYQLIAYDRIANISAGTTTTVSLQVDPWSLSVVDATGTRVINPGTYSLYFGGSAPNFPSPTSGPSLHTTFTVATPNNAPVNVKDTCNPTRPCFACLDWQPTNIPF